MAFSERVELVFDVTRTTASGALATLKTDIGKVDGAWNKMKTGASSTFNLLKQNGPIVATAVATAFGTMANKTIGDFEDMALGAGKLRDSLGVTAEEASRLQEVAGDLGIPVEALETAIGRMNVTAANSPDAFDRIGAAIVRNRDGTINTTETFISAADAISRIPDAAQRTEAAREIFGKGWQATAELIMLGGRGIRQAMDAVEAGKIVDDEDIRQAREFRDNLDAGRGVVESLSAAIGNTLVPILNDLIGIGRAVGSAIAAIPFREQAIEIAGWVTGIKPLTAALSKTRDVVDDLTGTTHGSTGAIASQRQEVDATELAVQQYEAATERAAERTKDFYESATEGKARVLLLRDAQQKAAAAARTHAEELENEADAAEEVFDAFKTGAGIALDLADAQREARRTAHDKTATDVDMARAAQRVADVELEQARNTATLRGETLSNRDAIEVTNSALLAQAAVLDGRQREAILAHIARINGISEHRITRIAAELNPDNLANVRDRLNGVSAARRAAIDADVANSAAAGAELDYLARDRTANVYVDVIPRSFPGGGLIPRARGGFIAPGETAMVGEAGAEDIDRPTLVRGPAIIRRRPNLQRDSGPATVVNQTFHMPPGLDPIGVLDASRRYAKRNGPN